MLLVRDNQDGSFAPLLGDETLTRLDGTAKAPMQTLLAASWSDADRAEYGVYPAVPFVTPDGKVRIGDPTYSRVGDEIIETYAVIDAPPPTAEELRLESYEADGTIADLKTRLDGASLAEIDTWLNNNVTNLTQARGVLAVVIKALVLLRQGRL